MAWSDAARAAAIEARKRNMRLFHGTAEHVKRLEPRSMNAVGERSIFLTTSAKEARKYAQMRAGVKGLKPVVFMTRAKKVTGLKFVHHTLLGGDYFTTNRKLVGAKRLFIKRGT